MAHLDPLNDAAKVARLPQWAQDAIRDLKRSLAEARAERDRVITLQPPSRVAVQRAGALVGDGPTEHYLPDTARIRYYARAPKGPDDRVRLLGVEAHLRERVSGRWVLHLNSWAGEPHVLPVSGNCFDVEIR